LFYSFQFEILLCVQDELDPAVKIVRQLMEAYPLVNSRLFTGRSTTKTKYLFPPIIYAW